VVVHFKISLCKYNVFAQPKVRWIKFLWIY